MSWTYSKQADKLDDKIDAMAADAGKEAAQGR
jgi:hypothetical protein